MAIETPSPSPDSPSPSLTTASWHSVWQRRLWWLILALSGTLAIKERIAELRSQKQQMRKDNGRLAVLEFKIDGLFLKYPIGLKIAQTPDQL